MIEQLDISIKSCGRSRKPFSRVIGDINPGMRRCVYVTKEGVTRVLTRAEVE